MREIIANLKVGQIRLIFFIISIIFLIIGITMSLQKKPISYQTKAANVCGCVENGSCSLNGQYCANFTSCSQGIPTCPAGAPIYSIYICNNGKWQFAYPQCGGDACPHSCSVTIPTSAPSPSACSNCSGGLYNVIFKANRNLQNGESITCTVTGQGPCSCGAGRPCGGGYNNRQCWIGPNISQCGVSGLDCTCKPFNYNCTGTVNISGTLQHVTNGGSDVINLNLPPPSAPTSPPAPTSTPKPKPTLTPTPIPSISLSPTVIPSPTIITMNIPSPTLSPTPPNLTLPSPTITPTNSPTPQNLVSTPTNTPLSPTEIILVKQEVSTESSPTQTKSETVPTIPSSGVSKSIFFLIPISIIILGLII